MKRKDEEMGGSGWNGGKDSCWQKTSRSGGELWEVWGGRYGGGNGAGKRGGMGGWGEERGGYSVSRGKIKI